MKKQKINWQEEDRKYIWHPAQQMKDGEVFPPVVADHAHGSYIYDEHGKEYIDIISSWWCNLLGHANREINEAVKKQLDTMEHVIFSNFTHRPAIEPVSYTHLDVYKRQGWSGFPDECYTSYLCSFLR